MFWYIQGSNTSAERTYACHLFGLMPPRSKKSKQTLGWSSRELVKIEARTHVIFVHKSWVIFWRARFHLILDLMTEFKLRWIACAKEDRRTGLPKTTGSCEGRGGCLSLQAIKHKNLRYTGLVPKKVVQYSNAYSNWITFGTSMYGSHF